MRELYLRRRLLMQMAKSEDVAQKCCVRWWDYKGNIVKEQWVARGGSVKHPFRPVTDYDFLTFSKWSYTEDELTDIQHDYDVIAQYNTYVRGRYCLCMKIEAESGQTLSLRISSTFVGPNTYGIDWGDGNQWEGNSGEDNATLTTSHTYESAFNGWVRFNKGLGCTIDVSDSDDIIKEVHGLSSGSWNSNYGLISGNRRIDYITFGSAPISSSPYGGLSGITTYSPIFSTRDSVFNGTSYPACYIRGNSSHNGITSNVMALTKLIGTSGISSQSAQNMPDLIYSYIPKSVHSINYFFVNCPNLEVIDIEEGWYPRKNIDMSVFPKLKEDGFKRFLANLGTTSTARTITISESMMAWLSADEVAAAEAKGYALTTAATLALRRISETEDEEYNQTEVYPLDEPLPE